MPSAIPTTMKAVTLHSYGDAGNLTYEDVPVPTPADGEMLVAVKAASINPIDFKTRNGQGVNRGWEDSVLPVILGWDISGLVVQSKSDKFAEGDEIYSMPRFPAPAGAYAEYITVPAEDAAPKPACLDHIQAASVPLAALTAWQALIDTAGLEAGQHVLVQAAAGGVGHFAVQIAKWRGAHVTGTASARNTDFLREIGVDDIIDYTKTNVADTVSGMDVVFHMLPADMREISWATLKPGGFLISITGPVAEEEASAHGGRGTFVLVRPSGAQLAEIGRLIEDGAIRPTVDAVYPLDAVAEAHAHVEGGHTRGKVVIKIAD